MARRKKTHEQLANEGYVSAVSAAMMLRELAERVEQSGELIKISLQVWRWYDDEIKESATEVRP